MRGGCRQLNSERNLTLVAQNAQLHGAIIIFALRREFFAKLAGGTDTLAVERDDDIACFHAGLFRSRTGVDIAYEYSLAIGSAEKCAELSADVFGINAQPGLPAEEPAAVPFHRRDFGDLRHAESKGPWRRRHHLHGVMTLFGFTESRANGLRAAIAPHGELDAAARRNLMDHAAKLRGAFDALSVDFRHYVIFLEAGLGRGTVRNDLSQDHAALGRELQFLGFVGGHFMCFDAEPTRTVVADDDIQIIRFDARQDFDLLGVLIFQSESPRGLPEHFCVGEFCLLILPALELRL